MGMSPVPLAGMSGQWLQSAGRDKDYHLVSATGPSFLASKHPSDNRRPIAGRYADQRPAQPRSCGTVAHITTTLCECLLAPPLEFAVEVLQHAARLRHAHPCVELGEGFLGVLHDVTMLGELY